MATIKTSLSDQEKQWLIAQRVTRLTDNQEVLIYPMGAESYLSTVLRKPSKGHYALKTDIEGKNILVIPGYGNSCFLLAEAGANSVIVYDKDPVTIAWMKAFKKYYHYREFNAEGKPYPSIGELMAALTCWYPPLLRLPIRRRSNLISWVIYPKQLRRSYLFYMLKLVQQAMNTTTQDDFECEKNIQFFTGEIEHLTTSAEKLFFDTAFVPYLLGVRNGLEKKKDVVQFMQQLFKLVPKGHILVSPSRDIKEFYFIGKRYFVTTGYETIHAIPELYPHAIAEEDWFRNQGLTVFSANKT
ncbi:hypothetical protein [Legionella hackeliae]|uniref:Uncharacterized protein n=1 Tax=Legionella hackeliae TaxID=449 RepID=A0A0A8UPV4_LEGHA|nr:hypothetical protein [Legionella hackeliae]KTD14838.1 ABC transporter permease [Legionella hackeliae]CEK09536.1 conserved protein of unknown function [Legionella hackeliae]STX49443.1 ABC transporter permease [Legionella hackeliae]